MRTNILLTYGVRLSAKSSLRGSQIDCFKLVHFSYWEKNQGVDLVLQVSSTQVAVAIQTLWTKQAQARAADNLGNFVQTHKCDYGILISMGRRRVRKLDINIFEIPAGCL